MKKRLILLILVLLFFLLIFLAESVSAKVHLYFSEGKVSETYIKFRQEFGSQFGLRTKQYYFLGEYKVQILERIAFVRYGDRMEKERMIVALINEEESPFMDAKVRDLDSEEKVKKRAKEFSNEIFEKLKILERIKALERRK